MKRVMLAVAAALLIASCQSQSGNRLAGTKKRVVQELYLATDGIGKLMPEKEIKMVDTIFKVGDTIKLVTKRYIITR